MIRQLDPEKRQRYLDAALHLFAERGVQHTSTSAIAKAAGTAAGTLFVYFPTKQDLIDELLIHLSEVEAEYVKARLDPAMPVREAFRTIWRASVAWLLAHPDAFRYVQHARDATFVSDAVMLETGKNFAFYYTTIQRGLEEGLIKPYPVDLIGGFLYHDIVAMVTMLLAQPDPAARETLIEQGFEMFWDGIRVQRGCGERDS